MVRLIPITFILFILAGAFLSSCESEIGNPCDTCDVPCDTCDTTDPCDNCDTTSHPCDTCGSTNVDSLSHAFEWSEYAIPDEVNLTGCVVFGEKDIYAIGTYLYRYDGTTWSKVSVIQEGTGRSLSFADFTMFGFTSNDIWMVRGGVLDHYIGNGIAKEYRPGSSLISGVVACWGTSSNDMFFVGNDGNISHFDGTKFTKFPQVTTKNIRKVWGTSSSNVWASGRNYQTGESVLLHYNGSLWLEEDLSKLGDIRPGSHGLISVWTTDSSGHQITVAGGSFVYRKTDNGDWYNDSGKVENALPGGGYAGLNNIRGNSSTDFMVQGAGGFLTHWNGKTWKFYSQFFDWGNISQDAATISFKGNTACMVGTKNGSSWIVVGRRK